MTWVLDTALAPLLTALLLPHGRVLTRKGVILAVALLAVLDTALAPLLTAHLLPHGRV